MGDRTRSTDDGRYVCFACAHRHTNAQLKQLPDGTLVGLQSKEYALYCEAVTVLSWTKPKRQEYLERVERMRGVDARGELAKEILKWFEINRGSKR